MNPELEPKLARYARFLTHDGQRCARLVRTTEPGDIPAAYSRLCQAQLHLSEFLKSYRAAVDIEAEAWARIACRGYPLASVLTGDEGEQDALDKASVNPSRHTWAPGLTRGEVETVCYYLGKEPPPALADIEAIFNAYFGKLSAYMALV